MVNREQRRKACKLGVTAKELKAIEVDAMRLAVNQSTTAILAAVLMYMKDRHGWGGKRGMDLLTQVNETFDAYQDGRFTLEELKVAVETEMLIKLE